MGVQRGPDADHVRLIDPGARHAPAVPTTSSAQEVTVAMSLSISPTTLSFSPTPVGPECPGANCSYAEVTITNNGATTEHLVGATAGSPAPFWPTFGGTCNVAHMYFLPAGASCTFQWGFKPEKPGRVRATGQISFESGESVSIELDGRGTPH